MEARKPQSLAVRKPALKDGPGIATLIRHYAGRGFLLARTLRQVSESLRDFYIFEESDRVVACGALHLWSDLAEIRSLAVEEAHWRRGIGSAIVRACMDEARQLGVETLFVLTYQPDFFARFGFKEVPKDRFPQKIWTDCAQCPRFPNCDEVAMILPLGDGQG